ncbi:MAG: glycosyltransferase family 2 protein [Muribaculaceae bacterium]
MEKELPLVSVVIPTYKNRGNLKRAIDSVLNQTYPFIEVIVVDDNNSGDEWRHETELEMSVYADDKRVCYLKHEINRNGSAARNTGIKIANGEYIALLDDDDYFKPEKIKEQVEYLMSHAEYDAVYCQFEHNGNVSYKNLPYGDLGKDILLLKTKMVTPSLLLKSDAVRALHGFDESFQRHQDYEFLLRFFNLGFKMGVVQKPLTVIGDNQGENIPKAHKMEQIKCMFLEKFDDYIRNYSQQVRNYRGKVLARNYAGIFLQYIKEKKFGNGIRIMVKYSWRSPYNFFMPVCNSVKCHLKRN